MILYIILLHYLSIAIVFVYFGSMTQHVLVNVFEEDMEKKHELNKYKFDMNR